MVAFLDRDHYTVDETSRFIEICVNIVGRLQRQIMLEVSTQDGIAKGMRT